MDWRIHINDPLEASALEKIQVIPNSQVTSEHWEQDKLVKSMAGIHVLVIRSATKATRQVIEAGKDLRIIARAGTGLDNVDMAAAEQKKILVINTPGANAISVAELAVGLMISLIRFIPRGTSGLKEGLWEKKALTGTELYTKTVGVIGFGTIGAEVAKRLISFGCKILAYDLYPNDHGLDVQFVTLEELFRQSDIITIHAPKIPETHHLVNDLAFSLMKDGVIVIHTARGGIIDDHALYQALVSGKVAGAALDVFETEPPVDEVSKKLLSLDQVIGTPHIGASAKEAQKRVGVQIVQRLVQAIQDFPGN